MTRETFLNKKRNIIQDLKFAQNNLKTYLNVFSLFKLPPPPQFILTSGSGLGYGPRSPIGLGYDERVC